MMRVAIRGWAVRTPLGNTVDQLGERLLSGVRAARHNERFPILTYACRLAAPILEDPARSAHARVLHRMGLLGIEAALEAMQQAGATGGARLGLFTAMGGLRAHWNDMMPALTQQCDSLTELYRNGFRSLHPFWMLKHLSNNAHAVLAEQLGAKGEGVTFGGANAGAQALVDAIHTLHDGAIDAALVVAYDSLLEPETLVAMAETGALVTCDLSSLAAPYDEAARGMVPGEAAAALVVERVGEGVPLAFIEAAEGADGSRGMPDATTIARVVSQLARNDLVIDGCGCAQPDFDDQERSRLAEVLPTEARLTATQSATGHLGAAASLIQAIGMAQSLRAGCLPPIAGLRRPRTGKLGPVIDVLRTTALSALAVSAGAPGLVGAVRVSLPQ